MLIWLTMHINEFMFQPMAQDVRDFLQVFSGLEVLIELIAIIVLVSIVSRDAVFGEKKR